MLSAAGFCVQNGKICSIWCLKYDKQKITEAECACPCAERRRPAVLGLGVGAGEPHALAHGGLDGGAQAEPRQQQQQQQQHARDRGQHGTGDWGTAALLCSIIASPILWQNGLDNIFVYIVLRNDNI